MRLRFVILGALCALGPLAAEAGQTGAGPAQQGPAAAFQPHYGSGGAGRIFHHGRHHGAGGSADHRRFGGRMAGFALGGPFMPVGNSSQPLDPTSREIHSRENFGRQLIIRHEYPRPLSQGDSGYVARPAIISIDQEGAQPGGASIRPPARIIHLPQQRRRGRAVYKG